MGSSIGPARQALWALLRSVDIRGANVSFGVPIVHQTVQVILAGVSTPVESPILIGPAAANEETYGLELLVKYHDRAAAEERAPEIDLAAFDVAGAIRGAITANPTLRMPGATKGVVARAYVSSQRSDGTGHPANDVPGQQPQGLICLIEMTVTCTARAH